METLVAMLPVHGFLFLRSLSMLVRTTLTTEHPVVLASGVCCKEAEAVEAADSGAFPSVLFKDSNNSITANRSST